MSARRRWMAWAAMLAGSAAAWSLAAQAPMQRHPRRSSLVMWHSSNSQVWQNTWDGGEGLKDMFLRRGYPVYLWDGPRVGRANWSCETVTHVPAYRDERNFIAWNFGPAWGRWWPGCALSGRRPGQLAGGDGGPV